MTAHDVLQAQIADFPIQYLGLPLSVGKLRKAHLQPLVDKVTAGLPTWRAQLMNKAGRLTTVKAVMSSKCVHTILAIKIPEWVFKEIDKRRRGFLWAGKETATGGQCMVAWSSVCRPQEFGGLGIPDLRIQAFALRLRWHWLLRTDPSRPWRHLDLDFGQDRDVEEMFKASIDVDLGDGCLALFWKDRWCCNAPCIVAPELCLAVRQRFRNTRTVAAAVSSKQWIRDITGRLSVPALTQYVKLWWQIETQGVQLHVGTEDRVSWRWSPCRTYTARPVYKRFFEGSTRFSGARPIWKAWAPLKVKFFVWLAVCKRIWTADRRHRHGLQDPAPCILCDQELETPDHLFVNCSYAKQVWHAILGMLGAHTTSPATPMELLEWWLQLRQHHNHLKQRGFDSAVMLVLWCLWKERNGRTFNSRPANNTNQLIAIIIAEGQLWTKAGAKWLAAAGWPEESSHNSA